MNRSSVLIRVNNNSSLSKDYLFYGLVYLTHTNFFSVDSHMLYLPIHDIKNMFLKVNGELKQLKDYADITKLGSNVEDFKQQKNDIVLTMKNAQVMIE